MAHFIFTLRKRGLILFCVMLLINCRNNYNQRNFEGIITKKGNYDYKINNSSKVKVFRIKIVKMEEGGYVFGIADRRFNVLYQSSIFNTLGSFSKFGIYFDKDTYNIWYYSADYNKKLLLKYENGKYNEYKFDEDDTIIPEIFKNWIRK